MPEKSQQQSQPTAFLDYFSINPAHSCDVQTDCHLNVTSPKREGHMPASFSAA
jgi:hypothetical protein